MLEIFLVHAASGLTFIIMGMWAGALMERRWGQRDPGEVPDLFTLEDCRSAVDKFTGAAECEYVELTAQEMMALRWLQHQWMLVRDQGGADGRVH